MRAEVQGDVRQPLLRGNNNNNRGSATYEEEEKTGDKYIGDHKSHADDPLFTTTFEAPPKKNKPSHWSKEGMSKRMMSTWRRLKISVIVVVMALMAAVGVVIYGAVLFSRASTSYNSQVVTYRSSVADFPTTYQNMQQAQFNVTVDNSTYVSLIGIPDPVQIPQQDDIEQYPTLIYTTPSPIIYSIPEKTTQYDAISPLVSVFINYNINNGADLNSSLPLSSIPQYPLWKLQKTTLSTHPNDMEKQGCREGGGFIDNYHVCNQFMILSSFCFPITIADDNSSFSTDSSGCTFPFVSSASYVAIQIQNETTVNLPSTLSINVTLRGNTDPYIALEQVTQGTLILKELSDGERHSGLICIGAAGVIAIVGIVFLVGLFVAKNVVKRHAREEAHIPDIHARPPIYLYMVVTIIAMGITLGVGLPMLGHWSWQSLWTWTPFIGLMIIVFCGPLAIFMAAYVISVSIKRATSDITRRIAILTAIILLWTGVVLSYVLLIKPWRFDYGTEHGPDPFQIFWGVMYCLIAIPFSFTLIFCLMLPSPSSADKALSSTYEWVRISQENGTNKEWIITAASLFLLFLTAVSTMFLPPIWNTPFVNNYNTLISPYSLFSASSTIDIAKLYLDVVVFYSYIFGLCISLYIVARFRELRNIMHIWFRFKLPIIKVECNTTTGEILAVMSVIGLGVWWFWFWGFHYTRIASMTTALERFARTFGHMTNLAATLLLFPVTRNSMWVHLFGLPFERAVTYHKWLGYAGFVALTSHMLTWWILWGQTGVLLNNIFTIQYAQHTDNWSLPMMHIVWLGAAMMVLLSQNYFRRKHFELFYFSHHFFFIFFICGLIHSWSLWYFLAGPISLWIMDRMIRFYRGAHITPVNSVELFNDGEIVKISLNAPLFKYQAGQWAFINVPAISPLEWHPFTISSAPHEDSLTFHIKNMGNNTWTSRMRMLSEAFSRNPHFPPVVNVDGPYGCPPKEEGEQDTMVMVAGGIGITPIISMAKDLFEKSRRAQSPHLKSIKHVYLIWVVRDMGLVDMFSSFFNDITEAQHKHIEFHVDLRITTAPSADEIQHNPVKPSSEIKITASRPNLDQEIYQIYKIHKKKIKAMVCGPKPMVIATRHAAHCYGFDLHEETFEL